MDTPSQRPGGHVRKNSRGGGIHGRSSRVRSAVTKVRQRGISQMPRPKGIACLAILGGLLGAGQAHALLTTPVCLARKLKEWGNLRKCQGIENGKAVQGKAFDLAKCQTKFDEKVARLDGQAAVFGIKCRYRDNGDSTITDVDTGLMWERKNAITVTQTVNWTVAMTDFVNGCNGTSTDGTSLSLGCSIYHDWRLPNLLELRSIVDLSRPGCGIGAAACIDPIFEPT